jgi:hypothetical protein
MWSAFLLVVSAVPAAQQPTLHLPQVPAEEVLAPADWIVGPDGAIDETGQGRAALEIRVAKDSVWVGELVRVELELRIDSEFLRTSLIPIFRRSLDLPVQVEASWWNDADAELQAAFAPTSDAGATLARNDRVVRARRVGERAAEGRSTTLFALDAVLVARSPGTLSLPGARLRYAYASAFTEDFVNGRVPSDRKDAFVVARAVDVTVKPLPEEGRPASFGGAVGRFTLEASADRTELAVGDSLSLTLRLEGDGDLATCEPPHLSALGGFDVRGMLDDRGHAVRTIVLDLAPTHAGEAAQLGKREIPALSFAFFDPAPPGSYRTVESAPIALRVSGAPRKDVPYERPGAGSSAGGSLFVLLAIGAIVGAATVALGIALSRRRRRAT